MQIVLENIGRKFNREWVFRQVDLTFGQNHAYAITGSNGSGKSTLLQIIAGVLPSTEGKVVYHRQSQVIEPDEVYTQLVVAAPYVELIEEFTLLELVTFHRQFKRFRNNLTPIDFTEQIGLSRAKNKPVKYFSSGMKQRLKLGLAFYSDTPVLLLDEPTSNLDKTGIAWYQKMVRENLSDRLVIICSNQPAEYEWCPNVLHVENARVR